MAQLSRHALKKPRSSQIVSGSLNAVWAMISAAYVISRPNQLPTSRTRPEARHRVYAIIDGDDPD